MSDSDLVSSVYVGLCPVCVCFQVLYLLGVPNGFWPMPQLIGNRYARPLQASFFQTRSCVVRRTPAQKQAGDEKTYL